jgi:1-acyl-sn-glycerol-3-phosphate acyltransferase
LVQTVTQAKPPLEFIPPAFSPPVLAVVKRLLPVWMTWHERITQVEFEDIEQLAQLYSAFQAGENRFLIAFRHPSPEDPYCLARMLWHQVPEAAQQSNIALRQPVHAHFIYDRGIPLWAGKGVGWLYSRLGGIPIQRGKVDRQGLRTARDYFANGQLPMAAAPEGGNNGHTEVISPLEPGIAQMGFWCVADLLKAQRAESVLIVPVGITYSYSNSPWPALEALLNELETAAGLSTASAKAPDSELSNRTTPIERLYPRLYRLGEHLLGLMETYYREFYPVGQSPPLTADPESSPLAARLTALLNQALTVAEDYFQLSAQGNIIDRCRRIEQAGWDRIYREDLRNSQSLSPVERGLADRVAEETSLRMWHMRLVENFVAVAGNYVQQKPTVERFAETLLLLRDTLCLIQGKNPFPRPKLGPQVARVTVGLPISVSDRWSAYQANRRQAIDQLTEDLRLAMESLLPHH